MMLYRHTIMRASRISLFIYLYGSLFFLCPPVISSTNADIEDHSKSEQSPSSPKASQLGQTSPCKKTDVEDNSNAEQSLPLPFIPQPGQSYHYVKTQTDEKYVIVDKTEFIRKLVDNDKIQTQQKVYFLTRPKTFGKTFFLSMCHAYLDGQAESFKGTAIASRGNAIKEDGKWGRRPVISIDFSAISAKSVEGFKNSLQRRLNAIAKEYKISTPKSKDDVIGWLIRALKSKFKFPVSILVDEFDFPVAFRSNKRVLEGIKEELKWFYAEIKAAAFASELWLVLIMGVSRLQVFSGYMNGMVEDITFDEKFSSILGFSKNETKETFKTHLDAFAVESNWNTSADDAAAKIEDRYGGYCFSEKGGDTILDAGSVCSCLRKFELADFEPKTKALENIVERMIKERKGIGYFKRYCIRVTELSEKYNTNRKNSAPLYLEMLCNGYLTILKRRKDPLDLCLTYPNEGIERRIERSLPVRLRSRKEDANRTLNEPYRYPLKALLQDYLNEGDMTAFVKQLISLAFPVVSPSLQFKVQSTANEHLATGYIFRILNAVGLDCKEGSVLDGNDGNPAGDIDLIIYASEENMAHYAISIKFKNNSPHQAIFQLFKYVVTKNDEFESLFDKQLETNVINLLALVIKNDKERQKTISAWIIVPYTRKTKRIWITKTEASNSSIKLNLNKYLECQAFFRENRDKFV